MELIELAQQTATVVGTVAVFVVTAISVFKQQSKRLILSQLFARNGKFSTQFQIVAQRGIEAIITDILNDLNIDRIRISKRYKNGSDVLKIVYEQTQNGIASSKNELNGIKVMHLGKFYEDLSREKTIQIPDTSHNDEYKEVSSILRSANVEAYYAFMLKKQYIIGIDIVNSKRILSTDDFSRVQNEIDRIEDAITILY